MYNSKRALIIGASSGVGRMLAEEMAAKGYNLLICSRDKRDLDAIAHDLFYRFNVEVEADQKDFMNPEDLVSFQNSFTKKDISLVFITMGQVSDNDNGLMSNSEIDSLVRVNYLSVIQLVSFFISSFAKKGFGQIVLFSSIATTAPRKNNIVYSSSKAALETYCRGLQHLLAKTKITVQVYRLGYIETSMSFGKKTLFPKADPKKISKKIINNLNKKIRVRNLPFFWFFIIFILKILPWSIYKRISF
jgi:decaprenylphospho-beta-D-erythro-pentofuranosid-2-ulose 2-reductase